MPNEIEELKGSAAAVPVGLLIIASGISGAVVAAAVAFAQLVRVQRSCCLRIW